MDPSNNYTNIVKDYENKFSDYEEFGKKLNDFLKSKFYESQIEDVIIKDRPKPLKSFQEKITRPDKNYSDPLNQITDLTGVRIIVCYSDQIPKIEKIISDEFVIDQKNSIDKSKFLKPDTFGYLSIHYIISIKPENCKILTWSNYVGLKAEIQIRTSLQDTWATVSHALQYKRETDVPYTLKRKLFRLAGLLELADEQFQNIKSESIELLDKVKRQINEGKTSEIKIDYLSISQFLSTSTMMREIIAIANAYSILGNQEILEHYNRTDCSLVTEECIRLQIDNIAQLETVLRETQQGNEEFLKRISKGRVWKASNAFILFLLIIKSTPFKFNAQSLVKKYGWDYAVAHSIIENATSIMNQYK